MKFPPPRINSTGFSLIEILTALAVLSILGLLIVQITTATSNSIKLSSRAIDASAQARLAFERIGTDLGAAVKRSDTDFQIKNLNSSASDNNLLFLASVNSPGMAASSSRGFSVIAYRIASHRDNKNLICLLRGGKPIPWKPVAGIPNAGFMGIQANGLPIKFSDALFPTTLRPSYPDDFDVLAAGVIRMVIGYQLYPDNQPVTLEDNTLINNARGQIVYSPPIRTLPRPGGGTEKYIDLSHISSLVVGLITIDLNSLKLVDNTQITTLAEAFLLPTNSSTPLRTWTPIANRVDAMPPAIPLAVRQSVRAFECYYPITPLMNKDQ